MIIIHGLEAISLPLLYFAIAALFPAYENCGILVSTVLALIFLASIILSKFKNTVTQILCGLLPVVTLLTAESQIQILLTVPALLIWFLVSASGKDDIYYLDYKYYFGVPALPTLLIPIVQFTRAKQGLSVRHLAVLCACAYLMTGILILRSKRVGESASFLAKLLNVGELAFAGVLGIVSCAALWEILLLSRKIVETILLPFGLLINGLTHLFIWISDILAEDPTAKEVASNKESSVTPFEYIDTNPVYPDSTPSKADYGQIPWHIVLYVLFFTLLLVIAYIVFKALRDMQNNNKAFGMNYEDTERDKFSFGKGKRKRRKRLARTNNDKVRNIYCDYLSYLKKNGITIDSQKTSMEILDASNELVQSNEASMLRALYIRARYNDANQLSNEEVSQAKDLWKTIFEEYEEKKRHAEY